MLSSWARRINGDFATPSNWSPAVVPGPSDDVSISVKGAYTVTSSVAETVNSLSILDKHATLLINGASTFSDAFGVVNHGTIVVDSGSTMAVDTSDTNATLLTLGIIDLANSLLVIGSGVGPPAMVLLTGGGQIKLSGGQIIAGNASFLTVVSNNRISGTGGIDFSEGGQEAHGQWINQGIIDASTPKESLTISHTLVENSNILEATNGGLLDFTVAPLDNTALGVVEATGANSKVLIDTFNLLSGGDTNAGLIAAVHSGTVLIQDFEGLDNTNGTIEAGHDSTVALEASTFINGGFVTILKGGLLESSSQEGGPNAIIGAVVANAGTIGAEGADLTITGDVTNTKGTLDANNATLEIDGAVIGGKATIEGTGEIVFGGPSSADVRFGPSSGAILKLENPSTFTGIVFGLRTGAHLDLTNINFANDPTLCYSSKTHVLSVTDGVTGVTDTVTVKNVSGSFTAQSDGNGGILISDQPPSTYMVAISHDQEGFVFALHLSDNQVSNANVHNDAFDLPHSEFAELAGLIYRDHHDGALDLTVHDANDHAAVMAQHTHHFLV